MKIFAPLIALLAVACVSSAWASDDDHDRARQALREGRVMPLETILEAARRDFPGQFLEAELEDEHGRIVYEIKVLTDQGHIVEIVYDAGDGSVIEVER